MHKVPCLITNTENKLACLLNFNLHQESYEVVDVYGSNMLAVKAWEPEFRLLALIKAVRQRWVLAVPDGEVEKGDGERLEKGSKVDLWSLVSTCAPTMACRCAHREVCLHMHPTFIHK